jgi:putative membrane protein
MTLGLDAALAYLHYAAIFMLFGFLVTEAMLFRLDLDAKAIRLLGRIDLGYFGAAIAALVTGFLRLAFGARGPDFYLNSWPIYVKVGLFLAVAVISVSPTLTFIQWRRALDHDPQWQVPQDVRRKTRRFVMIELHLAALIPVFAVIMARGFGKIS